MAINNAFQSFVRIFYVSAFGAHIMERPTVPYIGVPWGSAGQFHAWDETDVSAVTMIETLIDNMLPLFMPDTNFGSYIIYNKEDNEDPGNPVFAKNLTGKIGTADSDVQHQAYAKTYTYLTADNHSAKLMLMDVPTGGIVSKFNSLPPGDELDMVNTLTDPQWGWAGRDASQIVVWRSGSNDLNDALQKKYQI